MPSCLAHPALLLVLLALAAPARGATAIQDPDRAQAPRPALPPAVDLRPILDAWGLAPRVQGSRGTCSAFVLTGALEFALARRQGHGTRLSVEFLNWAANRAAGAGADGGFFSDLWRGFHRFGICPEADLPYCRDFDPGLEPPVEALIRARASGEWGLELRWIKEWNPKRGLTPAELAEVRRTLARGWPVCGGFLWPKEQEWREGVLQICPRAAVRDGHSVLLVGYRDDSAAPGGGRFLVRNTSGPSREGWLTYEYLLTYMNDAAWVEAGSYAPPPAALPGISSPFCSPPAGRPRRISSNQEPWHDANLDMTLLEPGQTLELPLLAGPGMITHIWMTSHAGWVGELDSLSLRIYWDGRAEPGVEVPLGDFFAVGQGRPAAVDSFPVQVTPTGSLSCWWRMPFARSARIVVMNENPDRLAGLYWQVDWVALESLPPDTPYFHARFRAESPARPGDLRIAELEGRGWYAGTVLSVTLAQEGWFGEGDDFFYLDGEELPSLQGTGSEDYFNDAWGFRSRTSLWSGQPRWQGDRAGDSGVCYRWHLLDPVPFARSLRLEIEHKGNREPDHEGFYLERPDWFASVAFWFQAGEPGPWPAMPKYTERRVPWRRVHLVPSLREAAATGGAAPRVSTEGLFGARPVLHWGNRTAGARLTLPFAVAETGRYAVRLIAAGAPGQGLHDIELDGKVALPEADFGAGETTEVDLLLGTHGLAAGRHELGFVAREALGRPAGPLVVEMVKLLALPPEAVRPVKGHHEAHFIRLGIGRAVYAYRLAYGALPESLAALAAAGILPERFLRDENGLPLESRAEAGCLVVESKGPEPWTHRWRGLDARR